MLGLDGMLDLKSSMYNTHTFSSLLHSLMDLRQRKWESFQQVALKTAESRRPKQHVYLSSSASQSSFFFTFWLYARSHSHYHVNSQFLSSVELFDFAHLWAVLSLSGASFAVLQSQDSAHWLPQGVLGEPYLRQCRRPLHSSRCQMEFAPICLITQL